MTDRLTLPFDALTEMGESSVPASQLGRRERKKKAVRETIRKETLRLIGRHGVDGLTIDAICDCVDIAKKTFYNYYATKHDLMVELCQEELLQRTDQLIDDVLASGKSFEQQLGHVIEVFINREQLAGGIERELIAYSVGAMSANISQGAGQLAFINSSFLRLYEHNRQALKPELSPAFCAEMTVGMFNAITLNWVHDESYDSENRYRQLLAFIKSSMLA
ncbi:MAG: TetR family transcriptional regulator [Pseudomonadota bacterium]|nr:TetR family transcriptional regulator [Pseudomonadota bacterium]